MDDQQLDSFLIVITLFLGLALVIALVGITNTLALSVFERTREIGLLRAVGMTRRQLRRAIRWEAAIVAVFGALLGVAVGVAFGVAATLAIPDTFVKEIAIPVPTLLIYLVVSATDRRSRPEALLRKLRPKSPKRARSLFPAARMG